MSLPPDVLDQVEAQLDGELDEAQWQALRRRHGAELDRAVEEAAAIRAAARELPQAPMPATLRRGILDALEEQRLGTGGGAPEDDAADERVRPAFWRQVLPVLLAAGLLLLVLPLLWEKSAEDPRERLARDTAPAPEAEEDSAGTPPTEAPVVSDAQLAEDELRDSQARRQRTDEPADRAPRERKLSASHAESAAAAAPAAKQREGASRQRAPEPSPAAGAANEGAVQSDSDSDADFAALRQEAEAYQQRTARQEPDQERAEAELPDQVLGEALAAELRRGTPLAVVGAREGTGPELIVRLLREEEQAPTLLLRLVAEELSPADLRGHLALEGLDADGRPLWRAALSVPERRPEENSWRVPLAGDLEPPAGVTALRVHAGDREGIVLDWPPADGS